MQIDSIIKVTKKDKNKTINKLFTIIPKQLT